MKLTIASITVYLYSEIIFVRHCYIKDMTKRLGFIYHNPVQLITVLFQMEYLSLFFYTSSTRFLLVLCYLFFLQCTRQTYVIGHEQIGPVVQDNFFSSSYSNLHKN